MYSVPRRFFATSGKVLTKETINPHVVAAEYAVRGAIVIRGAQIKEEIAKGSKNYSFTELTECNIGNPQYFGQKPISFTRGVLACLMSPDLVESQHFHKDIRNRAKHYQSLIAGGVGAYSESIGYKFARENVAAFIKRRDQDPKVKVQPDDIMLTDGASKGIQAVLSTIITKPNTGIMIPIPQYPLYTALITYMNAKEVPYYLNEDKGWQISVEDLKAGYEQSKAQGIEPKALVVLNPGNPTGQILNEGTVREIIKFAHDHKLVILADEVYQENIYKPGKTFFSFKRAVSTMPTPYDQTELFSFHSISKGFVGECGLRGGYTEMTNIDLGVKQEIQKLQSIFLCSNTIGQIATELMVNPPNKQQDSQESIDQYVKEKTDLMNSLKRRAAIVTESLNKMKNISSNEVEGAMYAFPSVKLGKKAIEEAKARKIAPDMFYCLQTLEKTGIVIVPGSGFRQKPGTHHFRITTLILPEERMKNQLETFTKFNDWFHNEYK